MKLRCARGLALVIVAIMASGTVLFAAGQSDTAAETGQVAPGPWGKYDPAISVSTVGVPVNPKYLGEGNSDQDNPWTRAYRDVLGIDLEYEWLSDEYATKVNLMIASGDIADFFYVDVVQFKQLVDAGLLADLKQAYSEYASADTKQVIEVESGKNPLLASTVGNEMLAIPWCISPYESAPMLWIRTDWLDALGLDLPETAQDVLDIARAFTTMDPDGNGEADTIGLLFNKGLYDTGWGLGFFNMFHAYPQSWIKDDNGNLVYGSVQPEVKAALLQMQEMYASGQLDTEFIAKDSSKAQEMINSGKCGLHFGQFHTVRQGARDNDPNAEFVAVPIPSIDSMPAKSQASLPIYKYWVVSNGCDYPEAPVKMLNMWMEYFYFTNEDAIYKEYNQGAAGAGMWQASAIKSYRGFKNVANAFAMKDIFEGAKTRADVNPEQRGVYDKVNSYLNEGNESQWRYTKIFGPNASMLVIDHYYQNALFQENEFYGAATPTMSQRWSTLEDKALETFMKIITGEPISLFDDFVEEWKRLGGDQITSEVNDWYSAR